jgi:hypothetical protein
MDDSACRGEGGRKEYKCFCMQGRLNNAAKAEYRTNKWLLRKYLRIKHTNIYTEGQ